MNLKDAMFNWLQIKIVAKARPDDHAANDTLTFFEEILVEDHHLSELDVEKVDESIIYVHYTKANGERAYEQFDAVVAEQLLADIISNPKYN